MPTFQAIGDAVVLKVDANGVPCEHTFPEATPVEIPDSHRVCVKGARRSHGLEEV